MKSSVIISFASSHRRCLARLILESKWYSMPSRQLTGKKGRTNHLVRDSIWESCLLRSLSTPLRSAYLRLSFECFNLCNIHFDSPIKLSPTERQHEKLRHTGIHLWGKTYPCATKCMDEPVVMPVHIEFRLVFCLWVRNSIMYPATHGRVPRVAEP